MHLHISKGKKREGKFSHKPTVLQSLDLLRPSVRGWLRRVSQKIHLQDHLSHHPHKITYRRRIDVKQGYPCFCVHLGLEHRTYDCRVEDCNMAWRHQSLIHKIAKNSGYPYGNKIAQVCLMSMRKLLYSVLN